ncbi:MAG: O-antigen ligase family protein [Gammaproteobacteria bacterium]
MSDLKTFIKNNWPCLLILLAFIGFVSKALYNYPIGLMALLGAYTLFKDPKIVLEDKTLKTFSLVFLCLWLPLLISFPDAVNKSHSARTVFPYLRFFFAGIFIIAELNKKPERITFIIKGIYYIVLFWCVDATIQFIFGKNLVGFPYEAWHITGMFYPRNTISHICAILSTFTFFYAYNNFEKKKLLTLSIIPLFFILLLSGRRAAWVMLALSCLGFVSYSFYYSNNKKLLIMFFGTLSIIITLLLSSTIFFHKPTNQRFKTTLGLFSGNYELINQATANRLPIWSTAINIFKNNPVNGIGPRGFRHVYTEYSSPEDYWHKRTQTQAHLLVLEVLAETGLIGFLGYSFALFFIFNYSNPETKKL